MKRSSDFASFVHGVAKLPLSVTDKAIACLWYMDHRQPGSEKTARELAEKTESTGLTGRVNITRLRKGLAASQYTVRGERARSFGISLARRPELDKRYVGLLRSPTVKVTDSLLPDHLMQGTRGYLEGIARQINGSYQFAFYDACAVLCRRMTESLLIDAFDNGGHLAAIEHSGQIVMLDAIIGQAKSGQYIRLARGAAGVLEKVKEIGDAAAHDRYHITSKQDIEEFRSAFRRVVSQLMGLAGISPKPKGV